jgi:hypothetical protein
MKSLIAFGLVMCFAVLASAQAGAPAAMDPPLRARAFAGELYRTVMAMSRVSLLSRSSDDRTSTCRA